MSAMARWHWSLALAALLTACGSPPPAAPAADGGPAGAARSGSAPTGQVLARSERWLIYRSGPGESLQDIARHFLGSPDQDWVIGDFNRVSQLGAGQSVAVPLQPFNPLGIYGDRYQTVPILCYHRFGGNGGSKMTVSASTFSAQLDWLARNGFRVLRLADLADWLAGKRVLPMKSVVITADDGYASFYRYAFPLLQRQGFAATLFVYTDFIGAGDAVDWAELGEMTRSGLVDVQAHSHTHRNLIERQSTETDAHYQQTLNDEIRTPQTLLARRLGTRQQHYAYPYGDANEAVLAALARHDYKLAVTVNPGGNAFFAQPLMLRRTMIFGDMSLEEFKSRLQISRGIDTR